MAGLEAFTVDTVDKVDREDLDALVDDPTYTWGWLKTFEELGSVSLRPRHIVVEDAEGLAAFAPCFVQERAIFDDVREELLLRWQIRILDLLSGIGLPYMRLNPCLVSGAPEGFSSRIITSDRIGDDAQRLAGMVIDRLAEQATADGFLPFGFAGVAESDVCLRRVLASASFRYSLRTANALMDIRWQSLAEYLGSLRKSTRKSIKHDEHCYARNGFKTRPVDDLGHMAEELSILAGRTYARYSSKANPFTPDLYRGLAGNLPGKARVFVAEREGVTAGFVLILEHKNKMVVHHCGMDYLAQTRSGHVYYNLVYQAPLRHAIARGTKCIAFGPGEWRSKSRRGCRFERLTIYLKSTRRLDALLLRLVLGHVDRKKTRWIRNRLSSAPDED